MKTLLIFCVALLASACAEAQGKLRYEHQFGLGSFTHRHVLARVDPGLTGKGAIFPTTTKRGFRCRQVVASG